MSLDNINISDSSFDENEYFNNIINGEIDEFFLELLRFHDLSKIDGFYILTFLKEDMGEKELTPHGDLNGIIQDTIFNYKESSQKTMSEKELLSIFERVFGSSDNPNSYFRELYGSSNLKSISVNQVFENVTLSIRRGMACNIPQLNFRIRNEIHKAMDIPKTKKTDRDFSIPRSVDSKPEFQMQHIPISTPDEIDIDVKYDKDGKYTAYGLADRRRRKAESNRRKKSKTHR